MPVNIDLAGREKNFGRALDMDGTQTARELSRARNVGIQV